MDVGVWLRGLGLGRYEVAFGENSIDADVLPKGGFFAWNAPRSPVPIKFVSADNFRVESHNSSRTQV